MGAGEGGELRAPLGRRELAARGDTQGLALRLEAEGYTKAAAVTA